MTVKKIQTYLAIVIVESPWLTFYIKIFFPTSKVQYCKNQNSVCCVQCLGVMAARRLGCQKRSRRTHPTWPAWPLLRMTGIVQLSCLSSALNNSYSWVGLGLKVLAFLIKITCFTIFKKLFIQIQKELMRLGDTQLGQIIEPSRLDYN